MKKILFGTSALIATAFTSVSGASAAGLELGLGGSFTFGGGFVYSKNLPIEDDVKGMFLSDAELVATARGTLDNGLTFGAKVELNIETSDQDNQHYDESVGWVEGSFGRIEVGHEDGAHDRSVPGVPGVYNNAADANGLFFDWFSDSRLGLDWGIDGSETSDSLKVTYWTPSFSGLKAGVSYVPNSKGGRNSAFETNRTDDAWELGVRYTGNFNDVRVDVGGGYTIDPSGNKRDDSWAVGGNVGFQQITLGGSYEDKGYNRNAFGVGATYNTGPWTFGASYANGDSITGVNGVKAQGASLGVDYELGQGVVVSAGVDWADVDGYRDDFFGAGVVTQLSF